MLSLLLLLRWEKRFVDDDDDDEDDNDDEDDDDDDDDNDEGSGEETSKNDAGKVSSTGTRVDTRRAAVREGASADMNFHAKVSSSTRVHTWFTNPVLGCRKNAPMRRRALASSTKGASWSGAMTSTAGCVCCCSKRPLLRKLTSEMCVTGLRFFFRCEGRLGGGLEDKRIVRGMDD